MFMALSVCWAEDLGRMGVYGDAFGAARVVDSPCCARVARPKLSCLLPSCRHLRHRQNTPFQSLPLPSQNLLPILHLWNKFIIHNKKRLTIFLTVFTKFAHSVLISTEILLHKTELNGFPNVMQKKNQCSILEANVRSE